MSNLFRDDNTSGYTPEQRDALNAEWSELSGDIEPNSDEYNVSAKRFSDEVASR